MLNRVLVGIDFSAPSKIALERGAAWAARLGVPLVVMHVVEHPAQSLFRLYAPMGDPAWFVEFEPKAKELLDQWLGPYPKSTGLIRTGQAAKRLVEEADGDTLLVVGHVGQGAIASLLFGSTAERVVRQAPGDVLVVRAETKG